jgi:dihydrofolate reductase
MGQLIYSMIVSADGFVADRDGHFDWAVPDEEVLAAINADTADVRTYLYGRRMYEMMHVWETDPETAAQSEESAVWAGIWCAAQKVVYSTTLPEVWTGNTTLEREFRAADVQCLKDADGDLTVDGPTLAAEALRLGLVDQIHMLVCPVTVGAGLRFLPDLAMSLALRSSRGFGNGMVQLKYDVVPGERP